MGRWAKAGVLDRGFEDLQALNGLRVKIEVFSIARNRAKVQATERVVLSIGHRKSRSMSFGW